MGIIGPFDAFARDAHALNVEEDESRLPVRWLAAGQVASRLADATPRERRELIAAWAEQQAIDEESDGVWSALTVPGIRVRDLGTASLALCRLAEDMERGGALNLAYATVVNIRVAMLERGPAGSRGLAAYQQARALRLGGLWDNAHETNEAALEDAVRAGDRGLEARVLVALAAIEVHRGDFLRSKAFAEKADALAGHAEGNARGLQASMHAAIALGNFEGAFDRGWRAYDAPDADDETRAEIVHDLAVLADTAGHPSDAERGLLGTIALTQVTRLRLLALCDLIRLVARRGSDGEVAKVGAALARITDRGALDHDYVQARRVVADAGLFKGEDLDTSTDEVSPIGDVLSLRYADNETPIRNLIDSGTRARLADAPAPDLSSSLGRFQSLAVPSDLLSTL